MAETNQEAMSRLERLYTEMSDGELLELASDPESLTEPAQAALEQVMRQRRLEAPVADDDAEGENDRSNGLEAWGTLGDTRAVTEALEPKPWDVAGMDVLLWPSDGLELSRACAALKEHQIEPAVETWRAETFGGHTDAFKLWVDAAQLERAKAVLREEMGLFPLPEADEIGDDENLVEVLNGEVGYFDSVEEAEEVCNLLREAGFDASFVTGAEADDEGEIWSTVKVEPSRREEALTLLAERFASE